MRVTQQDIARAAEVSQATVSRVLAGDERVEEEIRQRVLAAVERYNYRTDARARSLRTRSTDLVGLAIQRPSGGLADDPFYTSLISEILDNLTPTRFKLRLEAVAEGESQWHVYDELLRSRSVDGMILVESEAHDERLQVLQRDRFPFVLIGNPLGASVWSVDNDNVYAADTATQHLIDAGYRKVGFIGGREGVTVSEDRLAGYLQAAHRNGLEPRVWHADFGPEAAREASQRAFASESAPDSLVVLDDFMAMGVVVAARRAGLRIPEDLGIVSFNDSHVCQLLEGGLSSVSLDIPRLVKTALLRLTSIIDEVEDGEPTREIVPAVLKVRGSSIRKGALL